MSCILPVLLVLVSQVMESDQTLVVHSGNDIGHINS